MPMLDTLTRDDFKDDFKRASLKKARSYVPGVRLGVRRGNVLEAQVGRSRMYRVEVEIADNELLATCSCPYNWGGYCKHIAALLMKWIESPTSFVVETAVVKSESLLETIPVTPAPTKTPQEKPNWLTSPFNKRQQLNEQEIKDYLEQYKVQDLRKMAKLQSWPLHGTRKDEIIAQLLVQIQQPGMMLKSLLTLDDEHRHVWRATALLSDNILFQNENIEKVANKWGKLSQHKKIETYTAHLAEKGLAFPGEFGDHYWHQADFIPSSLMQLMPPALEDVLPEVTLSVARESTLQGANPHHVLRTVPKIVAMLTQSNSQLRPPLPRLRLEKFYKQLKGWDYVPEEVGEAKIKNRFKKHDRDLVLTVPIPLAPFREETTTRLVPLVGDAQQLTFFYHLIVELGLIQPGSPVTLWPEVWEKFLRMSPDRQWSELARGYVFMTSWSDLWLLLAERDDIQLKRQVHSYAHLDFQNMLNMLAVFRQQTLRVLACLPDDRWVNLSDLWDTMLPIWPHFDSLAWQPSHYGRNHSDPSWYLAKNGRMLDTANNKADWNMAQGSFIRHMLQGPLHWLGLADISYDEQGRLAAFRLHGLADLIWDRVESLSLPSHVEPAVGAQQEDGQTAVSISDTQISVNPGAVSAQAHNFLDQMATLEVAEPARFVYQLSVTAVHEAFEAGGFYDQFLADWDKLIPLPMPENIRAQLDLWWQQYGQVRLYEKVSVIELSDEYALAEIKAVSSLKRHIIAEISPRLVMIYDEAIPTLIAELEKAGYTPKADSKK